MKLYKNVRTLQFSFPEMKRQKARKEIILGDIVIRLEILIARRGHQLNFERRCIPRENGEKRTEDYVLI